MIDFTAFFFKELGSNKVDKDQPKEWIDHSLPRNSTHKTKKPHNHHTHSQTNAHMHTCKLKPRGSNPRC
jgi:hypothetical protein